MNTSDLERFWKKVDKTSNPNGCWEWTAFKNKGYGRFIMPNLKKVFNANRIAYEIAFGAIPSGMFVCHRCDNPGCVNPNHLWLGTNKDNVDDKVSKNRQQKLKGSQHGRAKLLEQDVLDIRASSETGAALSRKYNVSDTVIYNIRNRKTWQHI